MNGLSKRTLKTPLKNYKTKVAQSNQWANQWAGFQWAGFQRASFRGALLLGAVLLSLLFVGNLQAQSSASTKQGFFAGFVYLNGFKVDTTKKVTTNSTTTGNVITGYRITGSSDATSIVTTGGNPYWDDGDLENPNLTGPTRLAVYALLSANCESGAINDVNNENTIDAIIFASFTEGKKPTEASLDSGDATVNTGGNLSTGKNTGTTSVCFSYFFGDDSDDRNSITLSAYKGVSDDSEPTPTAVIAAPRTITSSKSDQLSGIGLQFGFRWEKWRASLTHFTGKGGDNELANTLVMADYFVNKGLFVGGGLASMKLTNGSTSASATSPAIQIGYKRNLTSNLSLNFGLTKYISGVSLKSRATPPPTITTTPITTTPMVLRSFEETQTSEPGDSATIGLAQTLYVVNSVGMGGAFEYSKYRDNKDQRIQVTQFRSRTVYINKIQIPAGSETQTTTTTETDAELKAPLVISLSFHLSF